METAGTYGSSLGEPPKVDLSQKIQCRPYPWEMGSKSGQPMGQPIFWDKSTFGVPPRLDPFVPAVSMNERLYHVYIQMDILNYASSLKPQVDLISVPTGRDYFLQCVFFQYVAANPVSES